MAISGNVTTQAGVAADLVRIFRWPDNKLETTAVPDAAGNWAAEVEVAGEYGIAYIATGCQPVTHGPYFFDGMGDPYWDKVVALFHFDGDFQDSTGKEWQLVADDPSDDYSFGTTPGGVPALHLDIPMAPATTYLKLPNTNDFYFDGDFTIECFVYSEAAGQSLDILASNKGNWSNPAATFRIEGGKPRFVAYGPPIAITPDDIPINKRVHVACCRQGSRLIIAVDGVLKVDWAGYSSIAFQFNVNDTLVFNYLGYGSTGPYKGFIDNLRITKGVARYTENFTPPTGPFPNNGPA